MIPNDMIARKMMRAGVTLFAHLNLLLAVLSVGNVAPAMAGPDVETPEPAYTVESPGSVVRGHLWISEGLAGVYSSDNRSGGNRLRAGGEIHFGSDYRLILGLAFLDHLRSGERSNSVGDISRDGSAFEAGYFLIPDRLWAMYSLGLGDIEASGVIGTVPIVDHQLSVGYRFYQQGSFSLALEGAYLFEPHYAASTFNYTTNAYGVASFPQASIWSLNFRIGWDMGGR